MTDRPKPPSLAFDASHPLIVFDGACVFCSGFVRMVVRLDRKARFRFATAQSPLGEALFRKYNLPTNGYETNLVLVGGVPFTRLDSFVAVMAELEWLGERPGLCCCCRARCATGSTIASPGIAMPCSAGRTVATSRRPNCAGG
ncbi:DUF393 domain-containing protein [Mesorhizobium sp. WSM3626]|uniref:thiol-disulfide oxidoreductase DCC family protein n=1 Tax=Mesorhizobium sp. WSM3626 TaxID=1040987 RepID=UPI0004B421F6|nr:DUF393 domain-containing protein [Mesorhizobium sp. WSM3626]